MSYLLDANIFIQAKNLHYGFDFCPAFWNWLIVENKNGRVFSTEKVEDEIYAGDDELKIWAKEQSSNFFLRPDEKVLEQFAKVSEWANNQHYEPAAISTFLQVADYYLICHALGHDFIIVTHEVPDGAKKRIKIPNACVGLGIKFMNPYEMLRREKARFVLGAK